MSRSPESSPSTTEPTPVEQTEGFEVAGAMEFGQDKAPVSAESRVSRALRSIAEGAYKVGDKLHDVADGRENRVESKDTAEKESSQESPKAIFRGLGRNARRALIGARVNLAVGKAKVQDVAGSVADKASSLAESAKDKFNNAKNKVNSFGAPTRDPSDVSDLVRKGETGKTFHRPNGKFMTGAELEAVRAHQDQIRAGIHELNGTKAPNIIDNVKRNATERVDTVRSTVDTFLSDLADRVSDKQKQVKGAVVETFTSARDTIVGEYRTARDLVGNFLLDNVNKLNNYFADRKSEAEARKAVRVQAREEARATRARNRMIDNRVVNAEVSRRLENRESRRLDPTEARKRGRIATRAAALGSAFRSGIATGRETYDALK